VASENGGRPGGRQKLELTWPHKGKRLLYDYDQAGKLHPRFTQLCPPEPRVLIDVDQYGTEVGKPWGKGSNLLIRGDNLLALKTLVSDYAGRVKLIYIDPPFNTGMAFEEYDDGLEHSTWLTMMRDRLELLRDLLAGDGSIWCEIDDTEVGYLNVLMDEIFGRENRIALVTVKRSAGTGHKAINPGPINVTDFLLGYSREAGRWQYHAQLVLREKYDTNYSKWIPNIGDPPEEWRIEALADVYANVKGYDSAKEARKVMGSDPFKKAMQAFAAENHRQVIRLAQPNYEGVSQAARDMIDLSKKDKAIHHLPRADHPDMYFFKGDRILFLTGRMLLREEDDEVDGAGSDEAEVEAPTSEEDEPAPTMAEKLTNFWDDIPWQGIANEGGVKFAKNKKPEKLLQRIIAMSTTKGDLVLDSFAGSGTTGAVAHKMCRRWIMIELGEHAETLARPRLQSVVDGEDRTGVTKTEGWEGGGGFRYLTLAAPLLAKEPELGLLVLNPAYSNGLLLAAVCLREGFTPTGDPLLHGQGGERTFAHVTEEFVTTDYLETITPELPEGGTVTVYCLAHDSDLHVPEGVVVRKLPGDLANRYCGSVSLAG
jgi:adenine-specific DNA-methyltransferase